MPRMQTWEKWLVNSWLDRAFHQTVGLGRQLRRLGPVDPSSILELGCGVGFTTELIVRRYPNAQVTAIDIDPDQVKIARRRLGPRADVMQGSAEDLPFAASTFGACFASMTFHHLSDPIRALQEINRILEPGGLLLIFDLPFSLWSFSQRVSPARLFQNVCLQPVQLLRGPLLTLTARKEF
jgi:ubiquinone/menaquinone biosynthesis C-methylase UbiE